MKNRFWPLLVFAFGSLVAFTTLSGFAALRRARESYREISELNERYRRVEQILYEMDVRIRSIDLIARDYLLDPSNIAAPRYRQRLRDVHSSIGSGLEELRDVIGRD